MSSTNLRYVALDHAFALECDHPVLSPYLHELFSPFARSGENGSTYGLRCDPADRSRATLSFDDEVIVERTDLPFAVGMLLWHLNRRTVEVSGGRLLLHSAVAARNGRAVLMPAEMESGKTTLVAGLVRAGLGYLSDEIAALDPETLRVDPYPKALSLDRGSWSVLADLRPDVPGELDVMLPEQWQVPATGIRPNAVSPSAQPVLVVMPKYAAAAEAKLEEVEPLEAVPLLAGCTFELSRNPARDLDAIGRLVREVPCYRFTYSSLEDACSTVLDLLEGSADAVA